MPRYLEDNDVVEQEKFRLARERVVAAQFPTTTPFEYLDEEQKRMRNAAAYATDVALASAPAIPTNFNPAAFRIAEEASMGAPIPAGVQSQFPFQPIAKEIPDTTPDTTDKYEFKNGLLYKNGSLFSGEYNGKKYSNGKEESTDSNGFPKAGTILRYRAGRAGFRIPIIADGKGGEYEGAEVADPDYKPGGGGNQFVEYEYSKDFKKRRAKYFNSATGAFSYGEWEDTPMSKEDYDAQQAKILAEEQALNQKRDAFALIEATMRSYGFTEDELKELNTYIQAGLLNPKLGPEQMVLQLRQLPVYKARFAGNEERRARGLNALSEANYLLQENAYAETLRQYGLQRFVTRGQFATFIGNDISNTEVGRRVKTAVERLQMGDPAILRQLRSYYAITDSDIVAYFLNPKEVLPELESKVTTAEIGATAGQYGLDTGLARASDLERYGVDLERARRGYSNIAQLLPRTTTLSDIYKQAGIDYTQTTAEEEEFKGLASAKRAREKLAELETAAFSGKSGLGRTSLTGQAGGAI
jgi:hypothetical protein